MFLYKNLFFLNIFYSFNPNHAYWNQRRLFSGNLPGMFGIDSNPCVVSIRNRNILSSKITLKYIKIVRTLKLFVEKIFSLVFSRSIPILFMGINSGYFLTICRVCLIYHHLVLLSSEA